MNICLIPARSGSKRIKNKNILKINKKPMIHWSIQIAKKSKIFKKIFVSSDSKKVNNIAKSSGALVPFKRPKKFATDKSTDRDVLNHFLAYAKKKNIKVKSICYMYPSCILISPELLKLSFKKFLSKNKNLISISSYNAPIQIALTKTKKNLIKYLDYKNSKKSTQNMKQYFHDAGQFYWFKVNNYKIKNTEINNYFYLDRKFSVDLDTKEDLDLLKILYTYHNR